MPSSNELVEIQHMFDKGKFCELIERAQLDDHFVFNIPVQLLVVRSLFEQGRFFQVEQLCTKLLEVKTLEDDALDEIRLWQAFLRIFHAGDPVLALTHIQSS